MSKKDTEDEKIQDSNEEVLDKEQKAEEGVEGPQKTELELAKERIYDLTNMLQRLQADFENYKKRTETKQGEFVKFANTSLITKLLPLVDNFEIGLKNTQAHEEFVKGMEITFNQLMEILKAQKVEKIKTVGEKFDPNLHQALMAVESDEEPNTVLEEFQPGYTISERIIRPAKVKVSKQ